MSFTPVIPQAGYNGWRFLQRTLDQQAMSHANTKMAQRDEAYFRENIGKINSAEELVNDRRLLKVTLAAFGMSDDLPNRAFIQRVLESPTTDPEPGEKRSFVQRLADKRYLELAKTFGFGDRDAKESGSSRADPSLALDRQDLSTRLTAGQQKDLAALAGSGIGETATWALIVGTPSLLTFFERAYDLPATFAGESMDEQIKVLKSETEKMFGSPDVAQFSERSKLHTLAQGYIDGFASSLLSDFHARQFEEAVGEQNHSMRLALSMQRDLGGLATGDQSENGKWFRILGTPSMRSVFETAFQLPSSFGSLDLDRQVDILKSRVQRAFGESTVSQFADPEKLDKLVKQFFIGEQLSEIQTMSTQSAALTLLQSAQANMAAFRKR